MKNYLIGVSAFTNSDLLEKCINSWEFLPKEMTRLLYFDGKNWKNEFKDLIANDYEKIKEQINFILTKNEHVGVGGAWNEILKFAFVKHNYDTVIIVGSDVEFKEGYIENYIKEFEELNCEFSTARGFGFNCFAITKKCYEIVGEFDLNFFPAYYDDNCYAQRVRLAKLNYGDVGNSELLNHWGSATIRKNENYNKANGQTFPMNQKYFIKKWGALPEGKLYEHPFNNPNLSIKDWTLDITEYNQKKKIWDI